MPHSDTLSEPETLIEATKTFQRTYILHMLALCSLNVTQAAERLGMERTNLYRVMRRLGIPAPSQRQHGQD